MKVKIYLILLVALFFSGNIFSQNKNEEVTGKITSRDFSDTKVTLKYELPVGDFSNIPYKVTFTVKTATEELNVLVGLKGDYGNNVRPGDNLSLTWNFTEEGFVKSDVKDSEMIITGTRSVPPIAITPQPITTKQKVKLPSVVLPSSVVAVGAGLFSYGILQELEAQDDYTFYKENVMSGTVVDNITITDELRTQYSDDAQNKRRKGITSMMAGGLVSAVGAYLLVKKVKARKETKRQLSFLPEIKFQNNASTSMGGKFVFNF